MTTRERLGKILRWLEGEFPVEGGRVRLRMFKFAKRDLVAYAIIGGKTPLICIDARSRRREAVESLLHEFAHVRRGDDAHDDKFWLELGRISRAWEDFAN